ncbi:hypothetical protein BU17DRAFT_69500 [Hysterangium stoloniferum]|nr:hypothetical protein BU17DRAFT_69500 [Hysterangium stoloniferum]
MTTFKLFVIFYTSMQACQLPDFTGNHFNMFFRVYFLVFLNRPWLTLLAFLWQQDWSHHVISANVPFLACSTTNSAVRIKMQSKLLSFGFYAGLYFLIKLYPKVANGILIGSTIAILPTSYTMAHFLGLTEGLDILPGTLVFPLFINAVFLPRLWVFALEWKWQRNKASDQPASASSAQEHLHTRVWDSLSIRLHLHSKLQHLPLLGVLAYRPKFINKKWEKAFEVDVSGYMVKGT